MSNVKKLPYAVLGASAAISKKLISGTSHLIDRWAAEGERTIDSLRKGEPAVEIEQVQEQVGKLRHQLEHMMSTWRANFQPQRDSQCR